MVLVGDGCLSICKLMFGFSLFCKLDLAKLVGQAKLFNNNLKCCCNGEARITDELEIKMLDCATREEIYSILFYSTVGATWISNYVVKLAVAFVTSSTESEVGKDLLTSVITLGLVKMIGAKPYFLMTPRSIFW